ncbi:MAG: response regulator [Gallionellaceae bacterium]
MAHSKTNPKTFCTTSEAAEMLSVSLRTAQLWAESGLLEAWKTDGGHRRITRQSVEKLLASPSVRIFPAAESAEKLAVKPVEAASVSPLKILIVEDEANLRRLYEINLRRWPMKPDFATAVDGYEALVRIGRDQPDLLITDLNMLGMDGFRMLYAICSMPELAKIKIVIVSGLDQEEIARHGGVPEGVTILAKPIHFQRLADIAEALQAERQKLHSQEAV